MFLPICNSFYKFYKETLNRFNRVPQPRALSLCDVASFGHLYQPGKDVGRFKRAAHLNLNGR